MKENDGQFSMFDEMADTKNIAKSNSVIQTNSITQAISAVAQDKPTLAEKAAAKSLAQNPADTEKMAQMKHLVAQLNEHSYKYYVQDLPVIADVEFDRLYDTLTRLEAECGVVLIDSPTKRVGGEILGGFTPYKHKQKLFSLDKCQTREELSSWAERVIKAVGFFPECSVEYKFDGLTLSLTYDGGKLVRGATRGDGVQGEDVTAQIMTIKSVPLAIGYKGYVEVQGEGIMKLSVFEQYNKTAKEPLKNARNGVAGAIRNLNPSVTASRKLDVICYNVNYVKKYAVSETIIVDNVDTKNGKYSGGQLFEDDCVGNSQSEVFEFLRNNKLYTSPYFKIAKTQDEVFDCILEIEKNRNALDFLIDGAVVKINDFKLREELGYTEKFPRWAVAFKYKAQEVTTILEDVIWQVSRTGKLNPLAILQPVDLGGVTVARATLNNIFDIQKKGVKIGSKVFIRRSNDVIPEIMGVAEYNENAREIIAPTLCPFCGTPVVEVGAFIKCPNLKACAPAVISQLTHFVTRDAMDIEGLSEKTIELLYNEGIIRTVADIYSIKAANLELLEGFKEKKTANLIASIDKSKQTTLPRFIYALGINNIGKKSARELAERFGSLQEIMSATREQLLEIADFGAIMAESIAEYFEDENNKNLIDKLLSVGLQIEKEAIVADGIFSGEIVVLTGSLFSYPRGVAKEIIQSEGGKTADSVSKNVTMVIAGDDAGSKLDKAKKLGIKILSEEDFKVMISKSKQ